MLSSVQFKNSISSCFFFLLLLPPFVLSGNNETDNLALQAIKSKITHDPLGITTSWNDSQHFCNWAGVTCGHLHQRVTKLNLSSMGLVGSLSPHIGNLSFLNGINLEVNKFSGKIPEEIGFLFRLKHLNLSNNSFSGEIPANLSKCSWLVHLRLGFNSLTGKIPFQLGSLQKLERMQLHYNNLTGPIPDSFGNLSSIRSFSLAVNNLEGNIPASLGQLKTLNFLGFGVNQFSGMIPPSVLNLSSLVILTLPYNQLQGTLPSNLGYNLPNLQVFNVGHNLLTGTLPGSLSNASSLLEIDIDGSLFTGEISIYFGGLPNLWWLVLSSNRLGGDLNFMNSLTSCRKLKMLVLNDNQFEGVLPSTIANLSTDLLTLRLGSNKLSGSIPSGIENLVNLTELQLQTNKFTGSIPNSIGNLKMLRRLNMSENELSGSIPPSLSIIPQLYSLHLEKNRLNGSIPPSFGNFQYLQELDLSQNYLSGIIPERVMGLSSLTISLNLARNRLSGPLPSEVSALKNLGYLDVSENMLSGEIPTSLGSCVTLEHLHIEGNFFEGSIPPSFISLRGLREVDFSRNNLSGQIPEFLQRIALEKLNLSFNHFEGEVPTEGVFENANAISLVGNDNLCGGMPEFHLAACPINGKEKSNASFRLKLMIPLLSGLLALVSITSLLIIMRLRKTQKEPSIASSSTRGLFTRVSYENLYEATGGFSSTNLIGAGSFGCVYKGVLDTDETDVAVKVLHLYQRGAFKSFMAECEVLRNIRHRNLVKVLTACSGVDFQNNEFKALVYEFMPNGSLESWLHYVPRPEEANDESRALSLFQRLNIAIDVASALDYLHHHCHKPVVHCDLKPSNILLDNDMTAHVSDFGLAKLIPEAITKSHPNQSSSIGLKGTIGYAAPEYGMGSKVSPYGDVYSYGILLLEMFTGKRPTDSMFRDGLDLHKFAEMGLPEQIADILDPVVLSSGVENEEEIITTENGGMVQLKVDQMQECLISIVRIGIACSVESPRERMDIGDVVKELQLIKDILRASRMNYSSISRSTRFDGSSSRRSAASNWKSVQ